MYVLMVVPDIFPNGDAGAVRAEALAKIYMALGYDVMLIGKGNTSQKGKYNDIEYTSLYSDTDTIIPKVIRYYKMVVEYRTCIKEIITKKGMPDIIHISGIYISLVNYLIFISTKNNIPLIHDSVEWYSPCEFRWRSLDIAYLINNLFNRKVIKKPINVIAISSYLENYFRKKKLDVVRIPVIMDINGETEISQNESEKIRLIYAGDPAGKDFLYECVNGFELLTKTERAKFQFDIYGVDENKVKKESGIDCLSRCIVCHGRVKRSEVLAGLLQSDFSVLLRPSHERYAKAGFPTKSVEAMSHGVAMLCNLSSDLGMYLKDMNNAVIVNGYDKQAFAMSLKRILALRSSQICAIKRRARQTAEKHFDYRLYYNEVRSLILRK